MSHSENLLPTKHRDDHSKAVGYPLGAENVTAVCGNAPQRANMELHFKTGSSQHALKDALKFPILTVGFTRRAISRADGPDADQGLFDPHWYLEVFAVPVEQKNAIHKLLVSSVLPNTVLPWLAANHKFNDHLGSMSVRFEFDATTSEVTSTSQQNLTPPRA
jgi:hypothetical protein